MVAAMLAGPSSSHGHGQPPMSLLVILPPSAHIHQQRSPLAPADRPSPLNTRRSGSTIPSLKSLSSTAIKPPASTSPKAEVPKKDAGQDMEEIVGAGRRLSLAPGIGAGTQTRSTHFKSLSTLASVPSSPRPSSPIAEGDGTSASDTDHASPLSEEPQTHAQRQPASFGAYRLSPSAEEPTPTSAPAPAPAFGARKTLGPGSSGRMSRRRPNTAAASPVASTGNSFARGSVALPSGMGIGLGGQTGSGKNRPGWEGDEVVRILRGTGVEVTVIRNSTQIPTLLSPTSPSSASTSINSLNPTSLSSRPSTSSVTSVTPVILVPLCDSPTLPSLSLLLNQGTTPSAVCFQQDLLERARRTEQEWLPSATQEIRRVVEMRDQAAASSSSSASHTYEKPVVLAYSANPALSSTTIASCVEAGASGVLKPPFDTDTARSVRRMVRAAREGRISSVVGLPRGTSAGASPLLPDGGFDVVLPPTALQMGGGEHENEKALAAAMKEHQHQQQQHGQGRNGDSQHSASTSATRSYRDRSGSAAAGMTLSSLPASTSISSDRNGEYSAISPLSPSPFKINGNGGQAGPGSGLPNSNRFGDPQLMGYTAALSHYNPASAPRRRSVDVGGLTLALRRAERIFEAPTPSTSASRSKNDPALPSTPQPKSRKPLDISVQANRTELAELLSAMYYQTTVTIDVEMAQCTELLKTMDKATRKRLIHALSTWDFKPHHLEDGDLFRVATLIFEAVLSIEGVRELGIQRDQMNKLLYAIRAIYHAPNPYHNYVHAIDVLQATYSFLMDIGVVPPLSWLLENDDTETRLWVRPDEEVKPVLGLGTRRAREVLRPQDVLAVCVAAIGHDVGHPGLSNAFMKNAKTPLSTIYDDKSVLENMHCMLIVQLLRKHGFDFLLSTSTPDFDPRGFRKVLYSSVLATDMSLHFAWMGKLKELGATVDQGRVDEGNEEDDRVILCQAIIKCADISNPTRPIDVSEHWSSVLLEEWAKQASLEQELDLPVSVIASADAPLQAKGQVGFIDLFTQPLFEAVSDILPELQPYADSCADNRSLWQTRLDYFAGQSADFKPSIVQPTVECAAYEEFRSLFPLLLPTCMVDYAAVEPGPASPSTPIRTFGARSGDGGTGTGTGNDILTPPSSSRLLVTVTEPDSSSSTTTTTATASTLYAESPSAKAMRAVYHTNLLDQRHGLSSWALGGWLKAVPVPGMKGEDASSPLWGRRGSTPLGI